MVGTRIANAIIHIAIAVVLQYIDIAVAVELLCVRDPYLNLIFDVV